MILADTSIWVDHLSRHDPRMAELLEEQQIATHPSVIGELALGVLTPRHEIIMLLKALPRVTVADGDEVLQLIDRHDLAGTGIGYVDAQLLAATLLTPDALLWTRDARLSRQAVRLGLAA
jgi:predicted nucleic acid-binding protein